MRSTPQRSCLELASCILVHVAGSRLLDKCLLEAKQDDNIKEAYLHVQANNEEAMRFYRLFNFAVGKTIPNYYKKLDPPDAVVLRHMLITES